ncbi:MAG: 23S rRNA (pseudouridine(1915)-N(3))-methyltransferase RlmH, partial [Magnetococcales bacterium]|nr:23S rRNA (pseudouridine(1915)-N(3))-methyltransferase RlmH [Magnetococcales bacterium]
EFKRATAGCGKMKLTILAVGRGMPDGVRLLVDDYRDRFRRQGGIDLIEVAEERRVRSLTKAQALSREADRIEKRIPPGGLIVPLIIGVNAHLGAQTR